MTIAYNEKSLDELVINEEAARALKKHTEMTAKDIAVEALRIAGEICIYTNSDIVIEELKA